MNFSCINSAKCTCRSPCYDPEEVPIPVRPKRTCRGRPIKCPGPCNTFKKKEKEDESNLQDDLTPQNMQTPQNTPQCSLTLQNDLTPAEYLPIEDSANQIKEPNEIPTVTDSSDSSELRKKFCSISAPAIIKSSGQRFRKGWAALCTTVRRVGALSPSMSSRRRLKLRRQMSAVSGYLYAVTLYLTIHAFLAVFAGHTSQYELFLYSQICGIFILAYCRFGGPAHY